MYDGRTNLSNDVVSEVKRYFPHQVYKSVIPRSVRLAEAPSFGQQFPYMLHLQPAQKRMHHLPGRFWKKMVLRCLHSG